MDPLFLLSLVLISLVQGEYESCPSNYVSAGESTCLSIGFIIGMCIASLVCLVVMCSFIKFLLKRFCGEESSVAASNPNGTATVVSQQQYGQTGFSQQPAYSQPM